jgi:hypothetical protein
LSLSSAAFRHHSCAVRALPAILFLDATLGLIGQSKTDRVRVIGTRFHMFVTPQWFSNSRMQTQTQCLKLQTATAISSNHAHRRSKR